MSGQHLDRENVDYTYDWYRSLLSVLIEQGYNFRHFVNSDPGPGDLFLRHDVDWSPQAALEMAKLEAKYDVTGSYFFLITSPFYNILSERNRQCVREIERLGHSVGLHFAGGEFWDEKPPDDDVADLVADHRRVIEIVAENPTETIAFHNPPEWTLNETFEAFPSTYEPSVFSEIGYESDSLHRWRTDPPFEGGFDDTLQLLVHPTLWGEDDADPATRIRRRREAYVEETDAHMRDHSRLEWTETEDRNR